MGILNCTPDSFFEGSRKQNDAEIAGRVEEILTSFDGLRINANGVIIDVGAYSTRPGAQEVTQEEELERMSHALQVIRDVDKDVTLSVDTFRPEVARMAVEEFGVQIINDVSEGQYGMFEEVARLQVKYVLMSVQKDIDSIIHYFHHDIERLHALGVKDVILDPGFGFGKTAINGNYAVLQNLHKIKEVFPDLPLLAGVSRKRMIWQVLGCSPEDIEAKQGTMILNVMALERGADILRVHDVKAAVETVRLFDALRHTK